LTNNVVMYYIANSYEELSSNRNSHKNRQAK